jgi:hypothetical protein
MFHRTKNVACLVVVIFAGALAWNAAPAGALQNLREEKPPWIVEKIPGNPVGYCHMKFPAIDEKTLGTEDPRLQRPESGNIIDFYGPCNHDPLGSEEVERQMRERQMEDSREGG